MIPVVASLDLEEIETPTSRYCFSGHIAPATWKRTGVEEETRFFRVSSKQDPLVNGVYCEPCLYLANELARQKRGKR